MDFAVFGGVQNNLMGSSIVGAEAWNFGLTTEQPQAAAIVAAKPSFYESAPGFAGKWDGKTRINHFRAAVSVLGTDSTKLVQQQPRGTCGGRAGSAAIDLVQCVMIAAGRRAAFKRASHAWLYYNARAKYGMARGNPNDERADGVPEGSIPEILTTFGVANRDETADERYYGAGSDDLACLWGAGRINAATLRQLREAASDNVVKDWAPVRTAQEAADGIASGGVLIGADSQGFEMSRDAQGFCRPRGTWYHYHVRSGVCNVNGRKGFEYWQSWGTDSTTGPRIEGVPGNVFRVDWDVQDACIRAGKYAIVFGVPLWELASDPIDMTWIF